MDEAEITVGGFVVAGCQPWGILELVEAALDHVAQGIDGGIVPQTFCAGYWHGVDVHGGLAAPTQRLLGQDHSEARVVPTASMRHARVRRKTRAATCPLAGKMFDEDGQPMRPSFSYGRGKRTYRYYVSETLLPNGSIGHTGNMSGRRISASRLERILTDRLASLVPNNQPADDLFAAIRKVTCSQREIRLVIDITALRSEGICDDMLLGRAQHHIDASAMIDEDVLKLTIDAAGVRLGRTIRPGAELLDHSERTSVLLISCALLIARLPS